MERKRKNIDPNILSFKSVDADTMTVVGLTAIHGNIDDGGDRSWPGSFADIKVNGRDRARFLWQHDNREPPIAAINYVREIPRADLPQEVLKYAPDATGAVEVSRTYLDTPRGIEVYKGIKAGAIQEMSYAYDIPAGGYDLEEVDGRPVRNIRKVQVFDFSDVNHGMNPATLASKAADWDDTPIGVHAATVIDAITVFDARLRALKDTRAKEGRILSESNRRFMSDVAQQIESTEGSLADVRKALLDLLSATEPAKQIDKTELRRLFVEYQKTVAQLNGVTF